MDLNEFGDKLRQEREGQGLSLKDVAEKTKVSRRCLEAIEQGRRSDLPHPVYAKGFVRHYSKFLGVDEGLVEDFLAEHFNVDDEPEFHRYEIKETIAKVRPVAGTGKRAPVGPAAVLVVLLLILCGLLGYLYFSAAGSQFKSLIYTKIFQQAGPVGEMQTPPELKVAPSEKEARTSRETAKEPLRAAADSKEIAPPARPGDAKPAEPEPALALKDILPEPAAPAQAPAQAMVAAPVPVPAPPPAKEQAPAAPGSAMEEKDFGSAGPLLVEILANQACWIEASVDTGQGKEFYLNKGQYLTTRFKDKMTVKLGNAGGVTVRFNGKDVPMNVPKSGVVTLQFP
ncbi:MAG: helix-turn-helix domain-containing protein [Desulfovibrionaceae bacterium]|nr:helix-turn-helix domain-containing protein [Desulfovibrionaceae bacterium]MBF0513606.1 helix-turn-helix domain-containing protein [Desulfovibrionaceae bacterium]